MTSGRSDPIGYNPLAVETQENPYPYYHRLLSEQPVYHNPDLGFWALSRFDDVRAALQNWNMFSSAEGVNLESGFTEAIGPEILNMDPPRHDQLRRLVGHHFSRARIDSHGPMIRSFAEELLSKLMAEGGGDFAADFSQRLPVMVICELMGIPLEDEVKVQSLASEMLLILSGNADLMPRATDAGEELRYYFADLIGKSRQLPRDDVVSSLANGEIDGTPLSDDEIFGMCLIIFLAGNTTTSALVSNGLYVLARHPDQRARLTTDLSAVGDAVEELLRYESPVQWTSRITMEDVELHGEVIPRGERVMMLIGAAHRDSKQWDAPNVLNLFRPAQRHIAFGEGVHRCIGAPLARLEGRIAFKMILERMPDYELAGKIERLHISTERGLARLPLKM